MVYDWEGGMERWRQLLTCDEFVLGPLLAIESRPALSWSWRKFSSARSFEGRSQNELAR